MSRNKRPEVLEKDGSDNDWKLKAGQDVWIKVDGFSVNIVRHEIDATIEVSVYQDGKETDPALTSCVAYYEDLQT